MSRYTVSVSIIRKSEVINTLMTYCTGVLGVIQAVLTEKEGEFTSDEMMEVLSILNVSTCTTAG